MADITTRPMRGCSICGGFDDHPRHVQTRNGRQFMAHMDCCADAGCATCQQTEADNAGRRGQELIDHLNSTRGA